MDDLQSLPLAEVEQTLGSSPDGLTGAEAQRRLFMTPLGWGWALFVWGYALTWFLVNDRVKLLAYRVFDPTAAPLLIRKVAT